MISSVHVACWLGSGRDEVLPPTTDLGSGLTHAESDIPAGEAS